jgi:hypothetical protein
MKFDNERIAGEGFDLFQQAAGFIVIFAVQICEI